jgi:hypothetical protein
MISEPFVLSILSDFSFLGTLQVSVKGSLLDSYLVGVCSFFSPRPAGFPSHEGNKILIPLYKEGWQIQICRGVFFTLTPPCGHPSHEGKKELIPLYRGV